MSKLIDLDKARAERWNQKVDRLMAEIRRMKEINERYSAYGMLRCQPARDKKEITCNRESVKGKFDE